MASNKIGDVLRDARKKRKQTAGSVANILSLKYDIRIGAKTIYSYERGNAMPPTNTFLSLCEIYEITDILYAFGYRDASAMAQHHTEQEEKMLRAYRESEFQSAINLMLVADAFDFDLEEFRAMGRDHKRDTDN